MLQFITDGKNIEETVAQAKAAIDGGCRWIQIRMKMAPESDLYTVIDALSPYRATHRVRIIVDDCVSAAMRSDVDGVHLGQTDMPIDEARQILGKDKIIGLTVNNTDHALAAIRTSADYFGVGPWRYTTTKKNLAPILGPNGVGDIMKIVRSADRYIPVVVIGGVTPADVEEIKSTGVDGIAISGIIAHSTNPVAVTQSFIDKLKTYNNGK